MAHGAVREHADDVVEAADDGSVHGPGGSFFLGLSLRPVSSLRNQTASSVNRAMRHKLSHSSMVGSCLASAVITNLDCLAACRDVICVCGQ